MTSLQVEANKLQEQQRTNRANESIKSKEADTHAKTYQMEKEVQPYRKFGMVAKSISDLASPVTKVLPKFDLVRKENYYYGQEN